MSKESDPGSNGQIPMRNGRFFVKASIWGIDPVSGIGIQRNRWIPFLIQIIGKLQGNPAGDDVFVDIILEMRGVILFGKKGFYQVLIQRYGKTHG